jgi:ParB/RepB/Spo0J family partition protein
MEKNILEDEEFGSLDLPDNSREGAVKQIEPTEQYISIPVDDIKVESNIRTEYDDEDINNLALSIKQYGQLEPIRVYRNNDNLNYVIIFGHRRYYAATKIDPETNKPYLKEIKCIITSKPDTLDQLYLQAIENEHSVGLTSVDREKYIKLLKNKHGQSAGDISKKLGKNISWIYRVLDALKVREKFEKYFNEAGLSFHTNEVIFFKNATIEEVKEAVEKIKKNPKNNKNILNELSNKKRKLKESILKTSFSSPDESKNTIRNGLSENPFITDNNDLYLEELDQTTIESDKEQNIDGNDGNSLLHSELIFTIKKNDYNKLVKINFSNSGAFNVEKVQNLIFEKIKGYYENKGYFLESPK